MKKIFYGLIVTLLLISINVYATEAEDLYDEIAPENVLTIKGYKPSSEMLNFIGNYLEDYIMENYPDKEYSAYPVDCEEAGIEINKEGAICIKASNGVDDYTHDVSIVWLEDNAEAKAAVEATIKSLKDNADLVSDPMYFYNIEDADMIKSLTGESTHTLNYSEKFSIL